MRFLSVACWIQCVYGYAVSYTSAMYALGLDLGYCVLGVISLAVLWQPMLPFDKWSRVCDTWGRQHAMLRLGIRLFGLFVSSW